MEGAPFDPGPAPSVTERLEGAQPAPRETPQERGAKGWTPERRAAQAERAREAKRKQARKPRSPKEAKPSQTQRERAELIEIQGRLAELLKLPALGMSMAGDEYPADHIRGQAPGLAHAIIERARLNPAFRAQLLRVMRISDSGGLVFALLAYAGPVLLYYELIPLPALRAAVGVPGRSELRVAEMGPMPPMPDGMAGPEEQRAYAEALAAEQAEMEANIRRQEAERAHAAHNAETPAGSPLETPPGAGPV